MNYSKQNFLFVHTRILFNNQLIHNLRVKKESRKKSLQIELNEKGKRIGRRQKLFTNNLLYNGGTWYCWFALPCFLNSKTVCSLWKINFSFMTFLYALHTLRLCGWSMYMRRRGVVTHCVYAIKLSYLFSALSNAAISWIFNAHIRKKFQFHN